MRCQCRVERWIEYARGVKAVRSEPIICPCDVLPCADVDAFNAICLEEITPA